MSPGLAGPWGVTREHPDSLTCQGSGLRRKSWGKKVSSSRDSRSWQYFFGQERIIYWPKQITITATRGRILSWNMMRLATHILLLLFDCKFCCILLHEINTKFTNELTRFTLHTLRVRLYVLQVIRTGAKFRGWIKQSQEQHTYSPLSCRHQILLRNFRFKNSKQNRYICRYSWLLEFF